MCCIDEVYKCLQLKFSVVNVYLDHLKLCVVCINGQTYVCCSECYVVSNDCYETNPHPVLYDISVRTVVKLYTLGVFVLRVSLVCNDICMGVVTKQFELFNFVFNSVYVDLKYDEFSLTFTAGSVCLSVVCSHVRLSWYPMWSVW